MESYNNLNMKNIYSQLVGLQKENSSNLENVVTEPRSKNTKSSPKFKTLLPKKTSEGALSVRGLYNLGNTCFYNSVLQCLAQTPNILEVLKEDKISYDLKNGIKLRGCLKMRSKLCKALTETLTEMRNGGPSFSPCKLLERLGEKEPEYMEHRQMDAHELLRFLHEAVKNSDLSRYQKIILAKLGLKPDVDPATVDSEIRDEVFRMNKEVSELALLVPDHLFGGLAVSRLQCQMCHLRSDSTEQFSDISIPVASRKLLTSDVSEDDIWQTEIYHTIYSCLSEYTRPELMAGENQVICHQCAARGETLHVSTKQMLFAELPRVLVLHLNRFEIQTDYTIRKLSHHVKFPMELDVTEYCKKDGYVNVAENPEYSLYGIVEHIGNVNSGHYVSYVKAEDDSWYLADDDRVKQVEEWTVLDAEAYLLFYKQL